MTKKPLIELHKNLLLFLNSLTPKQRKKFVLLLKKNQIDSIAEIFSNFLKSNLTQDKKIIHKLKQYRGDIQTVARKRTPLHHKIKVLNSKRGGFILSALLPLAASLITSLIPK